MAISSYMAGPGTLILDPGGDDLNLESQVKSFRIAASEKVKTTDPQPMLSGEDLETPDQVSLEWQATGKLLQDSLGAAGMVAYSWEHAMEEVSFAYVPNTATDRGVTGTLRLVPISVGGDMGTLPDSDVTWKVIGTPVLGDATP